VILRACKHIRSKVGSTAPKAIPAFRNHKIGASASSEIS
jgi:hypothetical protein